jgi:hypothetical protein
VPRPSPALREHAAAAWHGVGPAGVAVCVGCAVVALLGTVGGDLRWLAALGRVIVDRGAIPHDVPYASAPSGGWPNVPVLSELVLHGIQASLGDRGFLLAQVAAAGGGLAFLAADARRGGASQGSTALVVLLVLIGGLASFLAIRVQLFSLLLFPALAGLLRAEQRRPSRRVWLVPLLLALWSNLHGAVLVGLAVAGAYLLLSRARVDALEAAAALGASALAVCVTPALERTPAYYVGVLRNEAARRGEGLWAPLSLHSGVDLLLLAAIVLLVALALRTRPPLWEIVALAGLAVLSVKTARSGVWLLVFAAPPAARCFGLRLGRRPWAALAATAALLVVAGLVRGPRSTDAGGALIAETLRRAAGTPVLADGVLAEQVALAGGRVWMSNPLDAFRRRDQRLYLDWLEGRPGGSRALARAPRAVLVFRYGPARTLVEGRGLREVASDPYAVLYVKRS